MFIAMPYLQSRRKGQFSLDHCKKMKEVEVTIQHLSPSPPFFSFHQKHPYWQFLYVFNLESSEQLLVEYSIKREVFSQTSFVVFSAKQKAYSFVGKLKVICCSKCCFLCQKSIFLMFLFCSLISIVSQQINTFYKIKFILKIHRFYGK